HVMTRGVCLAKPDETIQDAARLMMESDTGSLPVGEGDRLIGMVTDRDDIAIRAVAQGKGPDTLVREVMTEQVMYCFDDQDIRDIPKAWGINRSGGFPSSIATNAWSGLFLSRIWLFIRPLPQQKRSKVYRSPVARIRRAWPGDSDVGRWQAFLQRLASRKGAVLRNHINKEARAAQIG